MKRVGGEYTRIVGNGLKTSIGIIDSFVDETFAVRLQPNTRIHFIIWFGKERSCKTLHLLSKVVVALRYQTVHPKAWQVTVW